MRELLLSVDHVVPHTDAGGSLPPEDFERLLAALGI